MSHVFRRCAWMTLAAVLVACSAISCAGGPIYNPLLVTFEGKFQHNVKSPTGNPATTERSREMLHLEMPLQNISPSVVDGNMTFALKVVIPYGGTDHTFLFYNGIPLSSIGFREDKDTFYTVNTGQFQGKTFVNYTLRGKFDWKKGMLFIDVDMRYASLYVNNTLDSGGKWTLNSLVVNDPAGYFVLPMTVSMVLGGPQGSSWVTGTTIGVGGLIERKPLPPANGTNERVKITTYGAAIP